jgi:ATP-dependent exoDNAse (exonuclease V) alpha subunit
LQQHADQAGAKLVLVGDTRQLQPIDAGGAMRSMRDAAGQHSRMDDIRRQHSEQDRQMVHALKNGEAGRALEIMKSRDYLKEHADAGSMRRDVAARVVQDIQEGKSSIALAARRSDVAEINREARALAREQALLKGDDVRFSTQRTKDGPIVEKQFAVGDRVIALQNDRSLNLKNGQTFTVTAASDGRLTLKRDGDGRELTITDKQYRHVDHAWAATVHKSQGATIDRAHVVHDSAMADRSLSYVAASRHRESMSYHYTSAQRDELQREMSRARDKDIQDPNRGAVAKAWARGVDTLAKELNVEGWRAAGKIESIRAQIASMRETYAARSEAREQMRETIKSAEAGKPQQQQARGFERSY